MRLKYTKLDLSDNRRVHRRRPEFKITSWPKKSLYTSRFFLFNTHTPLCANRKLRSATASCRSLLHVTFRRTKTVRKNSVLVFDWRRVERQFQIDALLSRSLHSAEGSRNFAHTHRSSRLLTFDVFGAYARCLVSIEVLSMLSWLFTGNTVSISQLWRSSRAPLTRTPLTRTYSRHSYSNIFRTFSLKKISNFSSSKVFRNNRLI